MAFPAGHAYVFGDPVIPALSMLRPFPLHLLECRPSLSQCPSGSQSISSPPVQMSTLNLHQINSAWLSRSLFPGAESRLSHLDFLTVALHLLLLSCC